LILAGQDPVAIDVVCGEIVGVAPDVLPVVRAAFAAGFGESRLENTRIRGEALSDVQVRHFRLPPREHFEWKMPEWTRRLLKDALTTRPVIDDRTCIHCGICQSHRRNSAPKAQSPWEKGGPSD
jgi:NAD-dependent dihydropyrimidine dehydrogenase PreA subunit